MIPAAPSDDRYALPPKLPALVERYASEEPRPVRFRLTSWKAALADTPGMPTRLLADPSITSESSNPRNRALGDRVVARDAVIEACSTLELADAEAVICAFVLVMAWGSGTRNSRSLRNIRSALHNPDVAAGILRQSATSLRAAQRINSPELAEAHRRFSLPGVREPFFTKWFAFAGITRERDWQPLILDSRVRNTLHKTLDVRLNHLADARRDAERYIGYLTAMNEWAAQLPQPMSPTRLEWIMFDHNGKDA